MTPKTQEITTAIINAVFHSYGGFAGDDEDQAYCVRTAEGLVMTHLNLTTDLSEAEQIKQTGRAIRRYIRANAPGHAKRISLDTLERYYQNISVHFMRGSSPMLNGYDIQSAKLDSLDGSILLTITLDGEDDVQFIADCTAAVHGNTSFISRNTNAQPDEIKP